MSICAGVTAATPGVCDTSFCSVARRGSPVRGSLCGCEDLPDDGGLPDVDDPPPAVACCELDDEDLPEPEPEPEFAVAGALAGVPRLTATISGPLMPAPKFFGSRSYALRAVVDVDSAAMSCWPRFSDSSGIVSGIRIASAASPAIHG